MLFILALYSSYPPSVEAINFTEPVKRKKTMTKPAQIGQTAIPQSMFYITHLHA